MIRSSTRGCGNCSRTILTQRPGSPATQSLAATTAFRNGTLQGAYLILAARAVGLDTGPMSGFDNAMVDELFLADRGWRSNFLCNIGHGDHEALYPRSPRLEFEEACVLM